ncbi:cysteine/serine endopeptidase inhibitor [Streptomyces naphthomycinicus]|uniref:cysteine/serine endopeptidase inhibitor n=1 Tax=Streptomyces naphthomycinicus TaxID=2872625 RepID=UPI00288A03F4|nr:cysteine/serine endopeptidase inhibitor [Streptomyces sp. TML10]
MSQRNRIIAGGAVALVTVVLGGVSLALADNSVSDQTISGRMTYYNDSGYGACGSVVDAASEDLVAVSHEWWTSADPNQDRLCRGVDVQVSYEGKTITVPVKDMCPSCTADHIDLSQTAFQKLAPLEKGLVTGITWKFVTDDGSAIETPSASPGPTGSEVPASGGPGGAGFPSRYAAPYVETWGSPDELEKARQAGLRYATLAFVLDGGGCKAAFNGNTPVTDEKWLSAVQGLRGSGGEVIASFGGASGKELAQGCDAVAALQEQYGSVVDALDLSRLDFDIEGAALADSAANHRRNQALAALQQQSEAGGHRLDVQFTLPSGTHGLEADGVALLKDAESVGLRVSLVNIMTMDYGSAVDDMGQAAIDAATGLHDQLGQIWTSKSPEELWAMEGNTPMIGVNDTPGEVFTTQDAERLAKFAVDKGIQQLSFWAVGRDKACPDTGKLSDSCSGTEQSDHQFLTTFNTVTTTSPEPSPQPTRSIVPVPTRSGTPAPSTSATPDVPDSGSRGGATGTGGAGQTIDSAFTTGYTWFDNTPRGSAQISAPVLHQQAGGTGTYADPITLAVGHSTEGGKDTLDYPAGTRFYMPRVRRYFIVEDACGDGGSPQNGPCHSLKTAPQGATTWLDMYVGGESGDSESAVQDCADTVTAGSHGGLNTVVRDPGPDLPVVEGPLFQNGKCTELY